MECSYKNRSHWKNISRHVFVVHMLIHPLSKFGGNRTNSIWGLAFYSVCFKWKNWSEKTALNMSIRRVIFTSSKINVKLPFLCQYLIFFNDFFYIRDFIWIITLTEKSKFEENCRSEGILLQYNLNCHIHLKFVSQSVKSQHFKLTIKYSVHEFWKIIVL